MLSIVVGFRAIIPEHPFTQRAVHQRSPVLWFDDTKLELFGPVDVAHACRKMDVAHVCRQRNGEAFNPNNTVPTAERGGGSIIIVAALQPQAQRSLFCCMASLKQGNYDVRNSAHSRSSFRHVAVQEDNIPVRQFLENTKTTVLERPAENLDPNYRGSVASALSELKSMLGNHTIWTSWNEE